MAKISAIRNSRLAIAIALLIGDGTASFISLKLGEGKEKDAEKGMAAGITGLLSVGLILFIIYNIFLEPLCWLFGATDATIAYALEYGRIISLGIIFCIFTTSQGMIRADGSPKIAMAGIITGCVINLIGDPIAIFVFDMGIKGAAYATVLGQLANVVIYVIYLCHTKSVSLSKKSFCTVKGYVWRVSKLGLASFVTQVAVVIVLLAQNNILVKYGAMSKYGADIPLAAMGITMKVFSILQYAIVGLTSGAQPIISYNYGSKQYSRVKQTLKITLIISVCLMAAATAWFQLAPMSIVRIFGSEEALYNEFSTKCLRIYLMFLVLDCIQMVGSSFFQSLGEPVKAASLVFLRQIVIQIPVMFILAHLIGVEGVLYTGPICGLVIGIVSGIMLIKEWKMLSKVKS